ncbi:MAG: sigma-54 dependent transcriptional regulator [Bacteroidetes bacterium]|nr:sigma-54 dependent transcriptional regulator [Bacteroidota bacterium]
MNTTLINLLLIEDESYDVDRIERTLAPFSDQLRIEKVVADGQSAIEEVSQHKGEYDVIIMDYQIVGALTGEKLIRKIKSIDIFVQIIVVTKMTINVTDLEFANRLINAGATWYCTKYPGDIRDYIYQPTDLLLSILNANEKRLLRIKESEASSRLNQSIDKVLEEKRIIGGSSLVKKLLSQIEKAAQSDATVLISGASGTGKEHVATHIHYLSKRKYESFVTVNAGSIPQELTESELFGFTKGSFTGAVNTKKGLFEVAHNGTIFLDEISELSMASQVKLLRVLQDGELDKIGRTDRVRVNVRVIAASNVDLEKAVRERKFREDLFYRLNVIYIYVPTLRERMEDIQCLVEYFLEKFSAQMSVEKPRIDSGSIEVLKSYDWPGNIRQLQNVVQRLLISCAGEIRKEDVLNALRPSKTGSVSGPEFWFGEDILQWHEMEDIFRSRYFSFVKEKTTSEAEAARKLGIDPSNFYRMCGRLGIKNHRGD